MSSQSLVTVVQEMLSAEDLSEAQMATLTVLGMDCEHCAARVRNALLGVDGVVSANVDLERALALVDYVPSKTDVSALMAAVSAAAPDARHRYRAATYLESR